MPLNTPFGRAICSRVLLSTNKEITMKTTLVSLCLLAGLFRTPAEEPTLSGYQDRSTNCDSVAPLLKQSADWISFEGRTVAGWQMSLLLPTNKFAAGKPISAIVAYRNRTTNQLVLSHAWPEPSFVYAVHVTTFNGGAARLTSIGTNMARSSSCSGIVNRVVPPAGEVLFEFQCGDLFDMSSEGVYEINVFNRVRFANLADASALSSGSARIEIKKWEPPQSLPTRGTDSNSGLP